MSILDRIDATLDNLCPCGAEPAPGSAYCGDDCTPTHISRDTDTRKRGSLATPMRWRPDLVTATDDTGLTSLGGRGQSGRFWRETFEREGTETLHLRVDDGHRFAGADVPADASHEHCNETWERLERELTDPRRLTEETDPNAFNEFPNWFVESFLRSLDQRTGYRFNLNAYARPRSFTLLNYRGPATLHIGDHAIVVDADLREMEPENPAAEHPDWAGTLIVIGGQTGPVNYDATTQYRLELPDGRPGPVTGGVWRWTSESTSIDVGGPGPAPFRQAAPGPYVWQRFCRACGRHGAPADGWRMPQTAVWWSIEDDPNPLATAPRPELCQTCPHCGGSYPGPPLTATTEHGHSASGTLLRLRCDLNDMRYEQVMIVGDERVSRAVDPHAEMQRPYDRMERNLLAAMGALPEPRDTAQFAPVGADPNNHAAWSNIGYVTDHTPRQHRTVSFDITWANFLSTVVTADGRIRQLGDQIATAAPSDEPKHPMLAAIEARRNRHTGPARDRLDGRRRRR